MCGIPYLLREESRCGRSIKKTGVAEVDGWL
jgi:hypothetical protein